MKKLTNCKGLLQDTVEGSTALDPRPEITGKFPEIVIAHTLQARNVEGP